MKISEKNKLKAGRGIGEGADYKSWIKNRELNSAGTASTITDYKNGRQIELLSQGEVYYYYLLRWRDDVDDIREQFPLNIDATKKIAKHLNYSHPESYMTTNLLVTKTGGSLEAYSVKASRKALDNPYTLERLYIEKLYWENINVPFKIVFKEDINKIFVKNIIDVTSCYDRRNVYDNISMLRHLIATKQIIVDMKSAPLNYGEILKQLKGGNV